MNTSITTSEFRGFTFSSKVVPQRDDIPQHQKNRSRARSVGQRYYEHTSPCKKCGTFTRFTQNNKCKECAK
jgi:hypothetical protein